MFLPFSSRTWGPPAMSHPSLSLHQVSGTLPLLFPLSWTSWKMPLEHLLAWFLISVDSTFSLLAPGLITTPWLLPISLAPHHQLKSVLLILSPLFPAVPHTLFSSPAVPASSSAFAGAGVPNAAFPSLLSSAWLKQLPAACHDLPLGRVRVWEGCDSGTHASV